MNRIYVEVSGEVKRIDNVEDYHLTSTGILEVRTKALEYGFAPGTWNNYMFVNEDTTK